MKNHTYLPILIAVMQIISCGHLYYNYIHESSQIPVAFIELNILSLANILVLVIIAIVYFKIKHAGSLWLIPAIIAIMVVLLLLFSYIVMLMYKYD